MISIICHASLYTGNSAVIYTGNSAVIYTKWKHF